MNHLMSKLSKYPLLFIVLLLYLYSSDLSIGVGHYNEYNFEEAVEIFTDILQREKKPNPIIHFMLGKIYKNKNSEFYDPQSAISNFQLFLSLSPTKNMEKSAKVNLAYLYLGIDTKKSKNLVDELFSKDPEDKDISYCYSMVYNRIGFNLINELSYKEAIPYFNKAISVRKELYGIANNIIYCYLRLIEQSKEDEKSNYCQKAKTAFLEYFPNGPKGQKTIDSLNYLKRICPEIKIYTFVE